MSDEFIGWGGTLERSTDGIAYTAVPRVRGLVLPKVTTEYQDVTSLDSPERFREYIKGLKDIGEVSVVCGYTRAGFQAWALDEARDAATFYRGTLANGDIFEYRAFPSITPNADDAASPVTIEATMRGTGPIDFTPAPVVP
ncbi:phage tail tube protein [Roseobacter sp. CCS2]|uniref:phage tail tube protein n=1 Tax=Roseobacter sp. CCS2 TaxID=391593 RepID=UPI0000F3C41F|nr:phage tail tube protein [Roseobacter sp. CCS2]EBA11793.1 hypothetical protein RCCS2_17731 [Roseobacter sp. CCS2]